MENLYNITILKIGYTFYERMDEKIYNRIRINQVTCVFVIKPIITKRNILQI